MPNLFCFTVVRPGTYEVDALLEQLDPALGMLAACDHFRVFSKCASHTHQCSLSRSRTPLRTLARDP